MQTVLLLNCPQAPESTPTNMPFASTMGEPELPWSTSPALEGIHELTRVRRASERESERVKRVQKRARSESKREQERTRESQKEQDRAVSREREQEREQRESEREL